MKLSYIDELEKVIKAVGIKKEEVCIIGSSVLTFHNIRENHDLDIAISEETRTALIKDYRGMVDILESGTINLNDNIQILHNRYKTIGLYDDELLKMNFLEINGYSIVDLEFEIAHKIVSNRAKDKKDISAIKNQNMLVDVNWKKIEHILRDVNKDILLKPDKLRMKWDEIIENNAFVYIYGAGKIGRKIKSLIEKSNAADKIRGFVVTDNRDDIDTVEGIKVHQIDEVDNEDAVFLISVTDVYQEDIKKELKKRKIGKCVNAFPYSFLLEDKELSDSIPCRITMDTRELLLQQYSKGALGRVDIVVRYLCAEAIKNCAEIGKNIYVKMQNHRNGDGYGEKAIERFAELIHSFDANGYDDSSEFIVDKNLKIIDGAHRLALALQYNICKISVRILDINCEASYGLDWFMNCCEENELEIIKECEKNIKERCLVPIKGIIWPAAQRFSAQIIKDINMQFPVDAIKHYMFDEEQLHEFIRQVYSVDSIEKWKVEQKYNHIREHLPYKVTVFDVVINEPDFRIKENGSTISKTGIKLKGFIRNKYKKQIDNYYHDIIFHTADNFYQSEYMSEQI